MAAMLFVIVLWDLGYTILSKNPHIHFGSLWERSFLRRNRSIVDQIDVADDKILSEFKILKQQYNLLLESYDKMKAAFEEEAIDHESTAAENRSLKTINEKKEMEINNLKEEKSCLENDLELLELSNKKCSKDFNDTKWQTLKSYKWSNEYILRLNFSWENLL